MRSLMRKLHGAFRFAVVLQIAPYGDGIAGMAVLREHKGEIEFGARVFAVDFESVGEGVVSFRRYCA